MMYDRDIIYHIREMSKKSWCCENEVNNPESTRYRKTVSYLHIYDTVPVQYRTLLLETRVLQHSQYLDPRLVRVLLLVPAALCANRWSSAFFLLRRL